MLLINYDLYDLHQVFLFFRMYPEDPVNQKILCELQKLIDTPQIGNIIENNILRRRLQSVDFADRELFDWVKTENIYTANVNIIKDPDCYKILSEALKEFSFAQNNPEQFSDLADTVHDIPLIMTEKEKQSKKKKTMKRICASYRKKWNPDFLKQYL